ncbi:Golgi complex component 7-domain-containing protein [Melampsora americana]|nr:Golgi complex component 7-domain-containing protein [Melampsora americana]
MSASTSSQPQPQPQSQSNQKLTNELDDDTIDLNTLNEYENEIDWLDDLLNQQETISSTNSNSQQESLDNLDKKLSKLLIILENSISDTSNLVENSITEIESSIPRLSLDLQLMRENSLLLRYSLESIQSKANLNNTSKKEKGIQEETEELLNQSEIPIKEPILEDSTDLILSRLKTLDLVKSRMEASRVVLEEAEAWSTLESEVTGYLTDPIPSYSKAAERLSEANKSMVVFQHTPEYEGRRALMRSLQNELEASLSTNLVKALSEKDVQKCKEFYLIFKMIEREGEFKNYYFGSRRTSISNLWKDAKFMIPILNSHNHSLKLDLQETLPNFLEKQFYPTFIQLLKIEMNFLPQIFNNPVQTLSAFIKTTIEHLQPSMGSQLNDMLDSAHILAGLPALINCWTITEDLGYKIENLITELETVIKNEKSASPALPVDPATDHQPKAHARKASMKRPISRRSGSRSGGDLFSDGTSNSTTNLPQVLEAITEWEIALYEPFIDFQTSYYDREIEYLSSSLINLNNQSLKSSKMLSNDTNALTTHASKIIPEMLNSLFNLGDEAINRCDAFTHGYSILECLNSIDKTLAEYLNSIITGLSQERENRELRKQIGRGHQLNPNENHSFDSHLHQNYNESDLSDLEGLDYSGEDWEMFQIGLKLLSTLKSTYTKVNQFEKKTLNRLTEILSRLVNNECESLETTDGLEFTKIKMSKGAKTLLKESRLNCKELWDLIELVLPGQGKIESSSTVGRKSSIILGQTPELNPKLQTTRSQSLCTKEVPRFYLNLNQAFKKLIKETQNIIQSVIISPLLKDIEDYSNLQFWNQSESDLKSSKQIQSISTLDLKILNELSKSPNESIIKLGEGLLNLPRLFEMIKEEEGRSLNFMIDLLPYIEQDEEYLKSLKINDKEEEEFNFELIISTWLVSLSLKVLDYFLIEILEKKVFKKSRLNEISRNQVLIDLEYLTQVLKALDINCSSLDEFKESHLS